MTETDKRTLRIEEGGDRLDKAIASRIPELSRSAVQRLIEEGYIRVNNFEKRTSYAVHAGDLVTVVIPPPVPAEIIPENLPLDIIFEDSDILVINKSAGMVVHPGAGNFTGTLVNAVLAHCPDLQGVGGVQRPGIVHRLDKDTSGVLIVAKNDAALRHLQRQFKKRTVQKHYMTLLDGRLQQSNGMIEAPIRRHRIHRQRMAVAQNGKEARTRWKVIRRYRDDRHHPYTLVDVELMTGRTHQIRVHFSWLGFPLVGDEVYGRRNLKLAAPRQFLHAGSLTIQHPGSEQEMIFTAPLPDDLNQVLNQLSEETGAH